MKRKCLKCKKDNDIEARICTCGYQFMQPFFEMKDFDPSPKQALKRSKLRADARKYLIIGVCLIFGFASIAFVVEPDLFLSKDQNKRDNEKASLVDRTLLPDQSATEKTDSAPTLDPIVGKVISVGSGNTLIVTDKLTGKDFEIRLTGIKLSDTDDADRQKARKNLSALVLDKNVFVFLEKPDGNGVYEGKVLYESRDINLKQIKSGLVMREENPSKLLTEIERNLYQEAENQARTAQIGLWLGGKFVAPNEVAGQEKDIAGTGSVIETSLNDEKVAAASTVAPPVSREITSRRKAAETVQSPPVKLSTPSRNSAKKQSSKADAPPAAGARATARCHDGTLSYSISRSGSCSSHGGVASWLGADKPASSEKISYTAKKYSLGSRGGCYYLNSNGNKTYVDRSLCN